MIHPIVKFGDPVLRAKGAPIKEVTGEIKKLAEDMLETMRAAHGVGLAAQQIGKALQITVIDVADIEDRPSAMYIDGKEVPLQEHMPIVLLNPVLKLSTERDTASEGCLSFPEITADIVRASGVHCHAMLLDGKEIDFEAAGLLARALQHEVDHLHGVLFIDRMNSATKAGIAGRLKRMQRERA
ncbi:MAG TPA: peptide deformylase [Chthoniobacteraceae bacterium]|jgi:peptide deformylase|nr:peptide deformylase [Chthoniobacteraceae bacterium]